MRLAQDFKCYIPTITGHGNFGAIDGSKAASMRYTEVKSSPHVKELYFGDRVDGIEWTPNYDGRTEEPTFLPCLIPMILVNGSTGMAVGMATDIPPHNVLEVIDVYSAFIKKELKLSNVRKYLKGPDTCIPIDIYDAGGIDRAYETGKGSYIAVAPFHIEDASYGRKNIVFTGVTPNTYIDDLLTKLTRVYKSDKTPLTGMIADIADESDMNGIRIVVTTKKGIDPKNLVAELTANGFFYSRCNMSMLYVHKNQPMSGSIIDLLQRFYNHSVEMFTKIFVTKIEKLYKRRHIINGIETVMADYTGAIKIISMAKSKEDLDKKLKSKYKLDDIQIEQILSTRLSAFLAKGEALKLEKKEIVSKLEILEKNYSDIDTYILEELKRTKVLLKTFKRRSPIKPLKK